MADNLVTQPVTHHLPANNSNIYNGFGDQLVDVERPYEDRKDV